MTNVIKSEVGVTRDTLMEREDYMSDIFIRNVDPAAVKTIDEKAKKRGMSRNEYLKLFMKNFVLHRDIVDLDSRYRELVDILAQRLEQCNDVIEENSIALEKTTDVLEKIIKAHIKISGEENYIS